MILSFSYFGKLFSFRQSLFLCSRYHLRKECSITVPAGVKCQCELMCWMPVSFQLLDPLGVLVLYSVAKNNQYLLTALYLIYPGHKLPNESGGLFGDTPSSSTIWPALEVHRHLNTNNNRTEIYSFALSLLTNCKHIWLYFSEVPQVTSHIFTLQHWLDHQSNWKSLKHFSLWWEMISWTMRLWHPRDILEFHNSALETSACGCCKHIVCLLKRCQKLI